MSFSLGDTVRRRAAEETGFSLIELLVSMALFAVVLGAILALLDTTAKLAPRDQERPQAIREAQVGLERMVRELRQATVVNYVDASSIDVLVTLKTGERNVRYDCNQLPRPDKPGDYRRCERREAALGAPLPALGSGTDIVTRVINHRTSAPVFTPTYVTPAVEVDPDPDPDDEPEEPESIPTYVEAEVFVPARGERKQGYTQDIVLRDGFFLRNLEPTS